MLSRIDGGGSAGVRRTYDPAPAKRNPFAGTCGRRGTLQDAGPMKLAGDITVAAPRQAVFEALRDARLFAACVEGVRDLQQVDATHYRAVMETKVAYIKFKFDVAVEVTRVEAPHTIEAKIEGTPHGIVGRLSATSLTALSEQDGQTQVRYEIEAALTGKLGSLGQPVIRAKAKEMERQFADKLRAAFAGRPAEAAQ